MRRPARFPSKRLLEIVGNQILRFERKLMEAAKIKYVVVPGEVTSKKDGQRHFVRAGQLMQLYGVNPKECVVISEDEYYRRGDMDGMTVLRPRYDGHYRHVSRPRCRC